MIDRRSPSEKLLSRDASTLIDAVDGEFELAIVLGSGLFDALKDVFSFRMIPYDLLLGMPIAPIAGQGHNALLGTWHGKRVVAFSGRVHLYQGFSAHQVTVGIRLAHAAGAKTLVLTNAAGALNPQYRAGDIMMISDHLNLTGSNPLVAIGSDNPFVAMNDAYAARLRECVRSVAKPEHRLHEGVYAGLLGPTYETPAESAYLRTIGADAVGMSTVLETIAARAKGMEVLGFSVITNAAGASTSHEEVTASGRESGRRLATLLDAVIAKID